MDAYIKQSLKNWASDRQPQTGSRARLLLVAASSQHGQPEIGLSDQKKEASIPRRSPVDQAMEIYNLPWLWVAHISLTPIRSVT
ncbi:MAG: hypothetical protein ACWGO1_04075 [Anaerolineales bacterium]